MTSKLWLPPPQIDAVDQYRGPGWKQFRPFSTTQGAQLDILTNWLGKRLTPELLGDLQGFGITSVRITTGEVTCSPSLGRGVTVFVDEEDIIGAIELCTQRGVLSVEQTSPGRQHDQNLRCH